MPKWGTISRTDGLDPRQILKSQHGLIVPAGGAVIQAGTRRVRAGHLLRQITGAGTTQYYWVHSKIAKVKTAAAAAATEIELGNADMFVAGDQVLIGAETVRTIDSVNYDTNKITLTAGITGAVAAGARVRSNTATDNNVDAISLQETEFDEKLDQSIHIAIAGYFVKTTMQEYYHTDDLENANGVTSGPGLKAKPLDTYEWS